MKDETKKRAYWMGWDAWIDELMCPWDCRTQARADLNVEWHIGYNDCERDARKEQRYNHSIRYVGA